MALLRRWNASIQLVAQADLPRLEERHLADSLALVRYVHDAGVVADIGSGAGFPGLVVAIVTGRPVLLVEANRRKASFLREAIRLTQVDAQLHVGRFEVLTQQFDLITARAVAPLSQLFEWAAPRLTVSGRGLFPKGRNFADELDVAERKWLFRATLHPSGTASDARILEVTDLRPRFV